MGVTTGLLPRARRASHSSISSLAAFAPAPSAAWRRPSRVALVLLGALVLLTTSALRIGGPAALAEPQLRRETGVEAQLPAGVMEGQAARAEPSEPAPAPRPQYYPVDMSSQGKIAAEAADAESAEGEEVAEAPLGEDELAPGSLVDPQLPVCRKTVLFRFAGLHGFGSEVSLLLRVASVASHYGYSVVLDSSAWNYGSWGDYFEPLSSPFPIFSQPSKGSKPCRPPHPSTKRFKMALREEELAELGTLKPGSAAFKAFEPTWTHRDHVQWLARDMDGLDATFLHLFAHAPSLDALHRHDIDLLGREQAGRSTKPLFLAPEVTLPPVHEAGFAELSKLAQLVWRPNEPIQESAGSLERRLALPSSVQAAKKTAADLLIGVHVRLGDKFLETDRIGPVAYSPDLATPSSTPTAIPGLYNDLLTSYFTAAIDSVHSLLSLPPIARHLDPLTTDSARIRTLLALSALWSNPPGQPPAKPTLVLMSDDDAAVEAFRRHPLARRFRIVGTSDVRTALRPTAAAAGEVPSAAAAGVAPDGEQELEEDVDDVVPTTRRRVKRSKEKGRRASAQEVIKALKHGHGRAHGEGRVAHGGMAGKAGGKRQGDGQELPAGFNEAAFNSLPLSSRIASARVFVRDVTVLARRSDALVVTGSSNVGRLMMLLWEAAHPPQEGKRRELRSLDTRWFPTARFT
ncbi:hypothetical protein Rhopal_002506-T1 [Rhodotorula paludigena]|uniref:Proteophosphoglycan 5 n=1 Tax=Rhodotorula paludigena TaxID=86838 RepID=A0AAV5GHZ2_9BASI|nr:hypothetical protein Rhopal_002506-T1 [Rhodotorula paludigena]